MTNFKQLPIIERCDIRDINNTGRLVATDGREYRPGSYHIAPITEKVVVLVGVPYSGDEEPYVASINIATSTMRRDLPA